MYEWKSVYSLPGHGNKPVLHSTGEFALQPSNGVRKVRVQALPGIMVKTVDLVEAFGVRFPGSPREPVAADSTTAYWVAPNDWLVLAPDESDCAEVALRRTTRGSDWAVTDVSDAVSIIEMTGTGVVARLREGCSVDLDGRIFSPGCYALTRLQNLPVTLHRLGDHGFRLLVDRSYARFLWDWLLMPGLAAAAADVE